MIRYPVKVAKLKALIRSESASWLERAEERTETFRQAGGYCEDSGIWSEVKGVYMKLQCNKCAYCERKLEGRRFGKIEHDIEHYRPKNSVEKWPSEKIAVERNIHYDFSTGDAWAEGYYLLSYNLLNYVTACKVCNTPLKSNFFPIAGERGPQSDNPRHLRSEKPFLIYPLGSIDNDPEELIVFDGIIPKPGKRRGHGFNRAQITIEFFELDARESLLTERAERIAALGMALALENNPTHESLARATIAHLTSVSSAHCNCARSFLSLYREDPSRAQRILAAVQEYLLSISW